MANPFEGVPKPLISAPYDPEPDREKIRGRLTLATIIIFGTIIVLFLTAALLATDEHWTRVKEGMQSVLPAVTSVLGTVIGFYFGSQKR